MGNLFNVEKEDQKKPERISKLSRCRYGRNAFALILAMVVAFGVVPVPAFSSVDQVLVSNNQTKFLDAVGKDGGIIETTTSSAKDKVANIKRYPFRLKTKANTVSSYNSKGQVSAISQFVDNEGRICFAYGGESYMYISRANKSLKSASTIKIKKRYPLIGAVTSDEKGYYYIVWGKKDDKEKGGLATIAVSKYNKKGKHIKTAKAISDKNARPPSALERTMKPFHSGNCDVAIHNGILVCSFARLMYKSLDGINHQSNGIIALCTSNMTFIDDIGAYTSHSFDQRVIYSKKISSFIFADHGDASQRGFCISLSDWDEFVPFHFYGELGDNTTNAHLGNISEVDTGIALVGASAKSYSQKAYEENKQLFIQIFSIASGQDEYGDPQYSLNHVIKGSSRKDSSGNTIDTNVKWLTNYSAHDVANPQMVVTEDGNIVVLWERFKADNQYSFVDSWFMVISPEGKTLQKATSMGNVRLNANEDPLAIGSVIYWVSGLLENATINELKLEPKTSCLVSFETGTAKKIKSKIVKVGSKIKSPAKLTRKGYKFEGWHTDYWAAFNDWFGFAEPRKWNFSKNKVTKPTVLYAKWLKL